MKSTQRIPPRRGWTLRGLVTEVLTIGNLCSILVLCLSGILLAGFSSIAAAQSGTSYVISAAPTALSFAATVNEATPPPQSVVFIATPATPLPFTMSASQPWIMMSAASGVTKSTLEISVDPAGMAAGTYSGQIAVTPAGAGNPPITIPVSLAIAAVQPVTISSQPVSQTVIAGQTATFSVTASGAAPITYQWTMNGVAIDGATSSSYTTAATIAADNGAIFRVTVRNPVKFLTSSKATLTVGSASAYLISAAPTALAFAATANGAAPPLQTVIFIATPATPLPFTMTASQPWITMSAASGVTKSTLQFGVNQAGMAAGTYSGQVLVTPSAGNPPITIPVSLTIAPALIAPSIASQPVSQTVSVGQTATFSVAASGSAPLSYQWNENGAAIAGATASSYTTQATASTDNGSVFTVTVSNSVSSVTSSAATLTVNTIYVISAAPTAFTFAATLNGAAPALQTVIFIATPATPLPFTMSTSQSWITMSASSGVTKSTLQFGVNQAGMAAGTYSGQVLVTPTGAGNLPITIPVTMTVAAPTPGTLTSSVSTLSFGSVSVGGNSSLPATLTNTGGSNVTISSVSISGAGFSVSGVPSGTILAAAQSATLNVTFDPSATGNVAGSVTVASNATDSSDSITLTGLGVQPVQNSVSLAWTASASTVEGYNTYQSSVSGSSYSRLNSSPDNSTSYTDTTVQAGQTYYYVVTAVNSSGVESAYSNEVSVIIPIS